MTSVFRAGTGTCRNPVNLAAARWVSAPVLIIEKEAEDEISNTRDCIMVTLPQSALAQRANDIVVCSGSNLNCYYAPANIKLPAYCFKGEYTYGGHVVFRRDAQTYGTTTSPPDLGSAQKSLRPGPPVFGHDRGSATSITVPAPPRQWAWWAPRVIRLPPRKAGDLIAGCARTAQAHLKDERAYCAPELDRLSQCQVTSNTGCKAGGLNPNATQEKVEHLHALSNPDQCASACRDPLLDLTSTVRRRPTT